MTALPLALGYWTDTAADTGMQSCSRWQCAMPSAMTIHGCSLSCVEKKAMMIQEMAGEITIIWWDTLKRKHKIPFISETVWDPFTTYHVHQNVHQKISSELLAIDRKSSSSSSSLWSSDLLKQWSQCLKTTVIKVAKNDPDVLHQIILSNIYFVLESVGQLLLLTQFSETWIMKL